MIVLWSDNFCGGFKPLIRAILGNSKIWRHEPLPVSKNNTRCVVIRQSMFVPLSLQNLSSSCHCPQVVRLSHDKKTHNFIHCYEKGPNNHKWPKLEICAVANIDIVAWQSKYKDLYGEKTYRFLNLGKWKDFNKEQLSLHKMCVMSLLCGPWADLWPFNGLYCKRFSLYVKVPVFFGVNSWFSRFSGCYCLTPVTLFIIARAVTGVKQYLPKETNQIDKFKPKNSGIHQR